MEDNVHIRNCLAKLYTLSTGAERKDDIIDRIINGEPKDERHNI